MADNRTSLLGRSLNYLLGFGLLLAIIVIAWRSRDLVRGFAYEPNMAVAAASTATALLAVALFVERSMAVVNAIVFGDRHRDAEAALATGNRLAGVAIMKDVLGKKERLRLFGSFIAALFISAAGVRTLEGLLVTTGAGAPDNPLLVPVDVVLTAGLIAGGSNGLAFLIQAIKDLLTPPEPDEPAAPITGDAVGSTDPALVAARPAPMSPAAIRALRARMTTTG